MFLCLLFDAPAGAHARSSHRSKCSQQGSCALIHADTISYDKTKKKWLFHGHVVIRKESETLSADNVSYDPSQDRAKAWGNVRFTNKTGDRFFVRTADIQDGFKRIIAHNIRALLKDDSRLAAPEAIQDHKNRTLVVTNGTYTPCLPCENQEPAWKIRARKVVRNNKEGHIAYVDSQFFFWGVPSFYMPYVKMPTRRSSGFLTPHFGSSTSAGLFVATPYFWALDHMDATLIPFVTTKRGFIAGLEFRRRGPAYTLQAKGSGTLSPSVAYNTPKGSEETTRFRGHLFLDWKQDIDDNWRLHMNGGLVTDTTYLRSLNGLELVPNDTALPYIESNLNIERFSPRSYASVGLSAYQPFEGTKSTVLKAPFANYAFHSAPLWRNLYTTSHVHTSHIHDLDIGPYDRLVLKGALWAPFISPWGQRLNVFGSLRGDLYLLSQTMLRKEPAAKTRGLVQGGFETSWPLTANTLPITLEPFLWGIFAPTIQQKDFPLSDSRGFEFHNNALTCLDRMPGYDQIDDGSRLTYGLKFLSHFQSVGDVRFLLGQVYSLTTPNILIAKDGIPKGFSDVVGVLSVHPADWLDLFYRFRVRNDAFDFVFNEASFTAGPSFARLGLSYNQWKDPRIVAKKRPSKKLLGGFLHFIFAQSWHARVAQNYDLKNNHLRNLETELAYKNDCMEVGFKFRRTFYHAKDVKPNNTYLFSLALKNIGTLLTSKPNEDFLS